MVGARVVARAWVDPAFRERLRANGTKAIAELGIGGLQSEHLVAVENTPRVHNVIVCTLCSCYPWAVLGLPPAWYKSPEDPQPDSPRAAQGPHRNGPHPAAGGRDQGLGLDRRAPLPGRARAAARHRRARRGSARPAGDARLDDWRRRAGAAPAPSEEAR